ncbi:hypothetical protein L596_016249 [Steinernema carpocapsae]|uniref:Uncharacterized protein n=1 Tax=Steinernema carpocapsae TaxID=34508 RepID=A0A4U5NIF0_STECR|nr:hypothetical protein L596_016249 [Steinernema carpocapsae]
MTIFFQVVIYAVNSTVVCLGYFILTQQHHSFIEISYITGDVTSMSTPYFLLFFSSRLRQALIRILPFQQTITVIRIPTVKFSVSRSSNLPTTVVKTT